MRVRDVVVLLLLALSVGAGLWLLPAGRAAAPVVHGDELARSGGRPCPDRLPIGDDPGGHGFGVEDDADTHPSLLPADRAWTCRYDAVEVGAAPSGGVRHEWAITEEPVRVDPAGLPALARAVDRLALDNPWDGCTADLGPTWLIVTEHRGDLTGIVVDSFGCEWVRLTDDPHRTPPGADGQEGAVAGVLYGADAVLGAVGIEPPD